MAVQSGITSIQACWNAPRGNSSANHTGFRIFYKPIGSGEDDEQSLVVAANVTCRTITGLQSEMTYTVSMVALGRQLPSAVVGPVIVPLERKTVYMQCIYTKHCMLHVTCNIIHQCFTYFHWRNCISRCY